MSSSRNLTDPARIRASQTGATLLEALVTLLVMSVGLLGMAALQISGMQETASALRHTQANWMTYDMADRIRANPAGAAAGEYNSVDTGAPASAGDEPSTSSSRPCPRSDGIRRGSSRRSCSSTRPT